MQKRLKTLLARARAEGLDGFMVTNLPNIRYLCGYSGSNGLLLVTRRGSYFYTDFRYQEQAAGEVKGAKVVIRQRDLIAEFPKEQARGVKRLGFEKAFLSYGSFLSVRKQLKGCKLVPCGNFVNDLRPVKEPDELKLIARAAAITSRTLEDVLGLIKPGVREKDLAAEIDFRFSRNGGIAFETIVASGPQGALPHARPGNRKLRKGDAIVFDMGAKFQGYCSDMTRTIFLGKAGSLERKVYQIVQDAQARAADGVKAGKPAAEVDALARDYIKQHGYEKEFGHGTGHGVGLEVHEQPGVSSRSKDVLKANSVVTIEPGIYLPGKFGVRIEDLVAVTADGCRTLSSFPKRLIEL
jgi:Xaa-Pro aminopeptidase